MNSIKSLLLLSFLGYANTSPASSGSGGLKSLSEGPGADLGTFKATMSVYGSVDNNGSGNCKKQQACGIWGSTGYTCAVSQNLYGVAGGQGTGPACGTCWKLTAETDSSKNALPNGVKSIVVMADNLCPGGDDSSSICGMKDLQSTNSYGAIVDFDLCSDSGASNALFGENSKIGLAIGTAEKVDCSQWTGQLSGKVYNK